MAQAGTRRRRHPPLRRLRHESEERIAGDDRSHALPGHLRETPLAGDPDSKNPAISGAWLGMSISGEVTAPVVYAHSGNPEDYDLLRKNGISVKGKIVLVRYSNPYSYRGFKALTAAARRRGRAFSSTAIPPKTDTKKAKSIPTAPGVPSITSSAAPSPTTSWFPAIRSRPAGPRFPARSAFRLKKPSPRRRLWRCRFPGTTPSRCSKIWTAPLAPEDWQGGLAIQYHLGGERVKVHLKIEMDNGAQPYYVVEGRIRGAELPDEWVVLGNHRDAWVFGGVDPTSGTASMMELTRALGKLAKEGMRPRRTLVVCSWDGEEVGLTGSTEWGEQFADELRTKAVAYINVDDATSGPNFHGQAVASLAPMLVETTRTLQDPSGKSLYEAWKATVAREKAEGKQSGQMNDSGVNDDNLADTRIGSGSDHTVFLNFVGMPVIGLQFDGDYGVYHSAYDDFYWMNHFGDPGYKYHTLMRNCGASPRCASPMPTCSPSTSPATPSNVRQFVNELRKGSQGHGETRSANWRCERSRRSSKRAGKQLNESSFEEQALKSGTVDSKLAAHPEPRHDAGRTQLAEPRRHPRPPLVQTHPLRRKVHLRSPRIAGTNRSSGSARLANGKQQAEILQRALSNNTQLLDKLNASLTQTSAAAR